MTVALGCNPLLRHTISKNFSAPRSAPNPASVIAYSPCDIAILVANSELQPWAMLANGPPCTKAAVFSVVCTRLGLTASLSNTVMAPAMPRSLTVNGSPSVVYARVMFSIRRRRSSRFSARHSIAISSEAGVMSKPDSCVTPLVAPFSPVTT